MKSLTSVLGWTLLLAVLAVPSFLFYNWWAKGRQQVSAEMTQDPQQVHNIFPPADKTAPAARAPAPVLPASQARPVQQPAPAAQPAPQAPVPAPAKPEPPAAPAPSASAQAPQMPPASQPAASQVQPVQVSTPSSQAVAVSTQVKPNSYYSPKSDRDPTLSPDDYRRIKEAEDARLEAERQQRLAERNRPKAPGIESRLHLQGIVGSAAIINGEMYSAGQSVIGVKIVKVGPNYIICEYKGKTFKKIIK